MDKQSIPAAAANGPTECEIDGRERLEKATTETSAAINNATLAKGLANQQIGNALSTEFPNCIGNRQEESQQFLYQQSESDKEFPAAEETLQQILNSQGKPHRTPSVAYVTVQPQTPAQHENNQQQQQQHSTASPTKLVGNLCDTGEGVRAPAKLDSAACGSTNLYSEAGDNALDASPTTSTRSLGSLVCRICHNAENPDTLVSPCLCKGSLTYVHIYCLERWISTSRSTVCELCQFKYNTQQTLRYSCWQSLRMWYSRSISRRALQEDCQMFSLLTLVAFAIVGTLLVGIQYYFMQAHTSALTRMWTKGWLFFFLFTTLTVYVINIYTIVRAQLTPWYRWWQSARDIKLILENHKPFRVSVRSLLPQSHAAESAPSAFATSQQPPQMPTATTTRIMPSPMPSPQSAAVTVRSVMQGESTIAAAMLEPCSSAARTKPPPTTRMSDTPGGMAGGMRSVSSTAPAIKELSMENLSF